ncbi:hypothetical protein WR25_02851 isoform E [Diploscapter pachys]|uniref:Uncharacterized protein n=1 Tax=Diploscapter pachys TaxID=2018661 RepID=A0A2A2KQ31_9BILA|nr:hypothetical protein WR25_02851 isoform E [Diploscapter pachys]
MSHDLNLCCEGSSEENLTTAVSQQSVGRARVGVAADAAHKKGWDVNETPSSLRSGKLVGRMSFDNAEPAERIAGQSPTMFAYQRELNATIRSTERQQNEHDEPFATSRTAQGNATSKTTGSKGTKMTTTRSNAKQMDVQMFKPLALKPAIVKRPKARKPSTSPITSTADAQKSNRISSPTLHTAKSQPSAHRLAAACRSNSPPDGVFARNEDISLRDEQMLPEAKSSRYCLSQSNNETAGASRKRNLEFFLEKKTWHFVESDHLKFYDMKERKRLEREAFAQQYHAKLTTMEGQPLRLPSGEHSIVLHLEKTDGQKLAVTATLTIDEMPSSSKDGQVRKKQKTS